MKRWVVVLLVVAASSLPVTAGATTKKPVKATTAAAIAEHLTEGGLGCQPFIDADDSQASSPPGGPPQGDTGECPVGSSTVSIAVYENRRELARAMAAMPIVCRYAVAVLGPVTFTFVTGRNWAVSTFRDEYDPAIGKALGGKVREVNCAELAKR